MASSLVSLDALKAQLKVVSLTDAFAATAVGHRLGSQKATAANRK